MGTGGPLNAKRDAHPLQSNANRDNTELRLNDQISRNLVSATAFGVE